MMSQGKCRLRTNPDSNSVLLSSNSGTHSHRAGAGLRRARKREKSCRPQVLLGDSREVSVHRADHHG